MKTAIANARVFDGHALTAPQTVVVDGDRIGTDPTGARVIDGSGGVLLPGLIDAHVHVRGSDELQQLTGWGVTTALDMGAWPPALVDSLRSAQGLTDIRSAGTPATASGSTHSRIPGFPTAGLVDTPADAARFVADRVTEGADYVKIVADIPGPGQATMDALVDAAHRHGKLTVAHAVSRAATDMALRAGVDAITHVPLDTTLDPAAVTRILTEKRVAIPTLTMMESIAAKAPGRDYGTARASVAALYQAGVPILAGTDANAAPGVPAAVAHGESLHDELALLVDAGLSPTDALRAATVLAAREFGLDDRGALEPGRRADLLLVGGDPVQDIRATRQVRAVWCGGIQHSAPPDAL